MSGFAAEWLDLREPLDSVSRSRPSEAFSGWLNSRQQAAPLQIVDLGAGTGANLRYLAPFLGTSQEWLLLDWDRSLLDAAVTRLTAWAQTIGAGARIESGAIEIDAVSFRCRAASAGFDLNSQLDEIPIQPRSLVTASALLDLVSESWLSRLVQQCARREAAVLFALTFDGTVSLQPGEAEDQQIIQLFTEHQKQDKGFGLALGPAAAERAVEILKAHGYSTGSVSSDWRIGREAPRLQCELLDGWYQAACQMSPARSAMFRNWRDRRFVQIAAGDCEFVVGHRDVEALPAGAGEGASLRDR